MVPPTVDALLSSSDRDGRTDICVMDADGGNLQNLTNNRDADVSPDWLGPAFAVGVVPAAVAPVGKQFTIWGLVKQVNR